MPYVIAAPCIGVKDKACVQVCPVDCIHPADSSDEPMLYINPDECIDCGACEPECPVQAICAEEDLPAAWSAYAQVNARFFALRDARDQWEAYKRAHAKLFTRAQ